MYKLKPHQTIRSTSGNRKKKHTSKAIIAQAYQSRCCFWRSSSVPESLENFHPSYASSKGKWASSFLKTMPSEIYAASGGYIFAVWAGVWNVASADNRSIFYRACAKFVTQFASNSFVKSVWVSRESNLRKLPANYSPRAFVLFFCFVLSGFKYFSRKISMDRLF